ncbi:hypothetical protein H6A16_04805 [Collinsella tanakaei]|uniref:hypothetical protein n=1 Tax=Collinsella tanakaei TaxID=626935 RepID=UPI00195DE705|nr:hypothetical protein [Collinsella tanakaei]MBM6778815.1 hypothetical protein [Collinsella tanakaei]
MTTDKPTGQQPDEVRFIVDYHYTDELVDRFVRLQVDEMRGRALLIAGVALFFIGCALAITSSGAPRWIGILLATLGVFAFWCRSNLDRIMAKRSRGSLDEGGSGNQRRLIVVADDGMAVEKNDEDARFFPFTNLTDVLEDDEIFVAVFGDEGVLLPRDAFKFGSADDFGIFIQQKRDTHRGR